MPNYPTPPSFLATIKDHERRLAILEAQMANRTGPGTNTGAPSYDGNVIWNGGMESGATGWVRTLFAPIVVETADPLDQLQSLRISEAAGGQTAVTWLPGGNSAHPAPSNDVFATAPGDVWRLQCLVRSSVATTDTQLVAAMGNTADDVLQLPGANTTWTAVSTAALVPGVVTAMQGSITIPASRNFIGLFVNGAFTAPGPAWQWWMDDVALQKRLS